MGRPSELGVKPHADQVIRWYVAAPNGETLECFLLIVGPYERHREAVEGDLSLGDAEDAPSWQSETSTIGCVWKSQVR